jgi:hypothetical protein
MSLKAYADHKWRSRDRPSNADVSHVGGTLPETLVFFFRTPKQFDKQRSAIFSNSCQGVIRALRSAPVNNAAQLFPQQAAAERTGHARYMTITAIPW